MQKQTIKKTLLIGALVLVTNTIALFIGGNFGTRSAEYSMYLAMQGVAYCSDKHLGMEKIEGAGEYYTAAFNAENGGNVKNSRFTTIRGLAELYPCK